MSDWVPIGLACPSLSDVGATVARRHKVRLLIAQGLVKARAFRGKGSMIEFYQSDDLEIFAEVLAKGVLEKCSFPFGSVKDKEWEIIEVGFLEIGLTPAQTSKGWVSEATESFQVNQAKCDWELGHFHRRSLSYREPLFGHDENVGFVYLESDVYGVEVEAEALQKLLGLTIGADDTTRQGRSTTRQGRSTKFDWEVAFADVAACFYFDAQFNDINAKGVQAQIIDMLRASFEDRRLEVPTDDTLKPKARVLLGALRSKKP